MHEHAQNLEFEQAQELKLDIQVLRALSEKQIVRNSIKNNSDIISHIHKYETFFIGVTQVRSGMILGTKRYTFHHAEDSTVQDIYENFLMQNYIEQQDSLDIVFGEAISISNEVQEFFQKKSLHIQTATRGEKMSIAEFTKNDVLNHAHKLQMSKLTNLTLTKTHMSNILKHLGQDVKKKKEYTFECYDVSHHQ